MEPGLTPFVTPCAAFCAFTAVLLLSPFAASAAEIQPAAKPGPAIKLGALFGDNMVLQQEMDLPVWGWSKPGTKIAVEFAGEEHGLHSPRMKAWRELKYGMFICFGMSTFTGNELLGTSYVTGLGHRATACGG